MTTILSRQMLVLVMGAVFCVASFTPFGRESVAQQTDQVTTEAQQQVNSGAQISSALNEESVEQEEAGEFEYEYQVSARPDPFKPFIAPKTVNPNELVDEGLELTGMQLFEPGQLTLVAVMDTPHGRIAMVEDTTKKGYKIIQGQLIGRRGQVTEIKKDEILVTETAKTRGGDEIKSVVSMKMKRDGDAK